MPNMRVFLKGSPKTTPYIYALSFRREWASSWHNCVRTRAILLVHTKIVLPDALATAYEQDRPSWAVFCCIIVDMKKMCSLALLVASVFSLSSCSENDADLAGYNEETQQAIQDLVKEYKNKDNAYVVSDFDNTTSIFDIAFQCSIYQLETMSFALSKNEIGTVLKTSLEESETLNNFIDDVTVSYSHLVDTYGEFSASGAKSEILQAIHSDVWYQEFSTKMMGLYSYVDSTVLDIVGYEWIMYWYTNMSEQEVYSMFRKSCEKYQSVDTASVTWTSPDIESKTGVITETFVVGVSVTESVKSMLKYYTDNGIDTWICSASHIDGVRAAVDAYGLSDRITGVIGMTQKQVNGKFVPGYDYETGYPYLNKGNGKWEKTDRPIKAVPGREGKVTAIKNALYPRYNNHQPIAGFMDASGDFNFCTEFKDMKMVICYNRANRKITEGAGLVAIAAMYQKENKMNLLAANAAGDTLYLLQGRNENGKRSLRESNYTIRFGETEEKLFANQDNDTLFEYLKNKKLTLKEFYDHFAIKTDAAHSVIGVAHGHLDSYSGYHSI